MIDSAPVIGETVKEFRITGRLGKGGMGEVWVAEQQIVKTKVAIKLLLSELSRDRELVERFFNEAIAVSKIRHSGIVKIYDVGFHRGSAYLIMELLEGESLSSRIRRVRRLPLEQVGEIGRQIASVLAATHAAKITHRDVKPDNIFLVSDDELASGERVKVLDFGIAKLGTTVGITGTGERMGTPDYMAPELWKDASTADARTDVYAVACIAFEMCCGRLPFPVSTIAEAYTKHTFEIPPRARSLVPDLPLALDEMIASGLAKLPSDRPAMKELQRVFTSLTRAPACDPSEHVVAQQLEATASVAPMSVEVPVNDEGHGPSGAPTVRRLRGAMRAPIAPRRWWRWLFVATGCIVLGTVVVTAYQGASPRPDAPRTPVVDGAAVVVENSPVEPAPGAAAAATPLRTELVDTVISANATGARVEIMGTAQAGLAPLTAKLEVGKQYKARVTAHGFVALEIDVWAGDDNNPIANLVPKPRMLSVTSDPSGALILLDNTPTGHTTPYDVALSTAQSTEKSVWIQLRKSGYRSANRLINMDKYTEDDLRLVATVDVKLAPRSPMAATP
jgi:tRNA A-37 threonylcarbamoyl transferase component Bud32